LGLGFLLLVAQWVWGADVAWKIGVWMERGPHADSTRSRALADSLVGDFAKRVEGGARLERFVLVRPGALPLAGGEAHLNPDLRDTTLDAVWGVPYGEVLGPDLVRRAERAWLSARGCPDERDFAEGWDLFLLPRDSLNKPYDIHWQVDSNHYVHFPSWSQLPDTGLDPLCRRILRMDPPGRGLRFISLDTLRARLDSLLPRRLDVSIQDDGGRPVSEARLELWRSRPDSRRAFGARLEGGPDTFVADTSGGFPLGSGEAWFRSDTLSFGIGGSNALTYWRVGLGRKQMEGWMDATDLARLADDSGRARVVWNLPGGSSAPWREASAKWPQGWLAAEADSTGDLTLGLSIPQGGMFVLRLVDSLGNEFLRSRPIHLARGVHEKILSPGLSQGWWDVRLDSPSQRWQVRVYQPARRPVFPSRP